MPGASAPSTSSSSVMGDRLARAKAKAVSDPEAWKEVEAELRALTLETDGEAAPAKGKLGAKSVQQKADAVKAREEAALTLADLYANRGSSDKLSALLDDLRPLFAVVPKAKTAKIVRTIIDAVAKIPGTTELQLTLCKEQAAWARAEKRTFLRQRIEARLAALLFATKDYQGAMNLIGTLVTEVKRLDDKLLLVDIHLLESRVHHALRNYPKSKAALTAARSAANAIYVPPATQAEIDNQSGTLHAEERDYKTAYSYFYEGFEQYSSVEDAKAGPTLKYMLLCKIMAGHAEDIAGIVNTKAALKYSDKGVEAMQVIADAYKNRSLKDFKAALAKYNSELAADLVVHNHLSSLYEKMLEQNLVRLIEPYACVEVDHIAKLIDLPAATVETKLSQMILDKTFLGTLDQGTGSLIVYDDPAVDQAYSFGNKMFETLGSVVDALMQRSQKVVS